MNPSIQFAKRKDGVKLAYTKFGEGQPLVCPAAWVTNLSLFLEIPFIKRFWSRIAQGVMLILYDKHGCGQSERNRKEFTLEAELLDLETIVDHVGVERFDILGISMGGPIGIAYVARHPKKVDRLILYGTYANGEKLAKEEVKSALISLVKASWGLGSKALADIFLPGGTTEQLQAYAKFQRESSTPEVAAKLLELAASLNVSEVLPDIATPTLILHREGDKNITIDNGRELAAEIPNARFKILKGEMHIPWLGESNEIIEGILGFLGRGKSKATTDGEDVEKHAKSTEHFSPDGSETVEQATIVFSDIVSSTDLVTRLGDAAARDIFLQHDHIVRDQLRKYGGRELQNLGDGFMLSFESASGAIRCARATQKEIAKNLPSIKVRMGINTGEVVRREGKHPFGQAVVLASRIVSKAKGDEILVSDVTKHLASGSRLPFLERGRFKPKGFDESIKLYGILWKD